MAHRTLRAVAAAGIACLLAACTAASTVSAPETRTVSALDTAESAAVTTPLPGQTVKPGAPVRFSHAEPGIVSIGQRVEIPVAMAFDGAPAQGRLRVKSWTSDGLTLESPAEMDAALDARTGLERRMTPAVRVQSGGTHNLYLSAEWVTPDGRIEGARTYTVQLKTDQPGTPNPNAPRLERSADGQALSVMDATETIGGR